MAKPLSDLHGASRSLAYLTLAAAPYTLVTNLVVPQSAVSRVLAVLITIGLIAIGLICWYRPTWFGTWAWTACPAICVATITLLNVVTHDASTGTQLFFLWPVLYAANFLSRRAVYATVLAVAGGDALTVFLVHNTTPWSDLAAIILSASMVALVVYALRTRADQLRKVLQEQARTDSLTGLANRRAFDDELQRAGAGPLALLTIDLDHFKSVNDTFGHAAGDQALQTVAAAMREAARGGDVVARLGGDEFVMLIQADLPYAVSVADHIRATVGAVSEQAGSPYGLSIGIATMPGDATTVDALMSASDAALYAAKTAGRGRTSTVLTPSL